MRILHTSDWHLGQKFLHKDRTDEHRMALNYLLEVIEVEKVDMVIVAGDVFDTTNPPNSARKLYYHFISHLIKTSCSYLIITAGNHDSPAMIEAPSSLLESLNVHVIGSVPESVEDQIIECKNKEGKLEAVVAAVPFLRDRDFKVAETGESGLERIERIRKGIVHHYERLSEAIKPYSRKRVPRITTGHLYVTGADAHDKQNNIYIGDVENIKASQFPKSFNYVALGHIHRAQPLGSQKHIRYSGSIIPLSFSETKDEKGFYLLDFENGKLEEVDFKAIPTFRRLKTIIGDLDEVKEKLTAFNEKRTNETINESLTPWIEVIVETDQVIPRLDLELRTFTKDMNLELLKIRDNHTYSTLASQLNMLDLDTLDTDEVFEKKCEAYGKEALDQVEMKQTFIALKEWILEQEKEEA
ncbi:MAG: exonuclease SbcCD subunit D C-terminal domain-containing protein [Bacteroidota bacterium]